MLAFLDRFEGMVLDNARRIISSLILLAIAVAVIYLAIAALNFADSPDTTVTDSFTVPVFEEPVDSKDAVDQTRTQSTQSNRETAESSGWQHPLPEYKDEIDNIVDDVYPLYVVFFNFELFDDQRRQLITATADRISDYAGFSENQLDDLVDGLESYTSDFSEYYVDIAGIDGTDLEQLSPGSQSNPVIEEKLRNPFASYFQGVDESYNDLLQDAERAAVEAQQNNISAMSKIAVVGGSLVALVLLIMLLILFKVENSLRRSADVAEKSLASES